MNTKTLTQATAAAGDAATHLADRAAEQAEQVLSGTRRVANQTIDRLQDGVDSLQSELPGGLSRAAAKMDDLARRGLDNARHASERVRLEMSRTGDATVGYIRDQPVKSVLIAAAAGAGIAALIGLLQSRRGGLR